VISYLFVFNVSVLRYHKCTWLKKDAAHPLPRTFALSLLWDMESLVDPCGTCSQQGGVIITLVNVIFERHFFQNFDSDSQDENEGANVSIKMY